MENNFNPFDNFYKKYPVSPKKINTNNHNPEISKKYFKNQRNNNNSIENIIKNTNLSDEKTIELIKHLYLKINKDSQNQIQDFIFNS